MIILSSAFISDRKGCFKNCDLWCRIGTALNRRRKVIVCKVRAHVLAPDSPLELAAHTWTSVVGNELADAFAAMRSRLTWFEPSARLISWQSAYRSSFIPRPYRLSPN